ncbi:MAG: glycosyltransferase [Saprospiraceae bacterium]
MPITQPTVSVCMIAYNVEKYIAQAIEGVLRQQTNFPIELVIGEDCSTDATREICEYYVQKYPDRIKYLPNKVNMGIGKNHYRTLMSCNSKYVAVCDSDDVWTDPYKLQYQIDFLEDNPDYGLVYTDIDCIDEYNNVIIYPSVENIRPRYAAGNVFFNLLQGNFINNCTVVFRRELINDYQGYINPICHDWLLWMRIATRTKIHYYDARTTQYRIHAGGVTNSAERIKKNVALVRRQLQDVILYFNQYYNKPINKPEKLLLFRKMMALIIHLESFARKAQLLYILPKYFPGMNSIIKLITGKAKKEQAQTVEHHRENHEDKLIPATKDVSAY